MSISHVKCSFIKATEGGGANIRTASSFQSCFPELLGEAPIAAPRFCSLPTDLRWIQTFRPTRKNSDSSHPSMSPVCQAHHLHTRGNAHRTHTERTRWLSLPFLLIILGKCLHFVHISFPLASLCLILEFLRLPFHCQIQCLAYHTNSRQIG